MASFLVVETDMAKDISNLSADEIKEQLQQLEQSRRNLEKALEQRKSRRKSDLAAKIRAMILDEGFDVGEILELVEKKKRAGASPSQSGGSYTTYVDPDNAAHTYVRGVLPRWMKAKMMAQHLDPSNKQDRDRFKEKYLKAVSSSD